MNKLMMTFPLAVGTLAMAAGTASAQNDSIRQASLQEVVVRAVRASENAPFAVTNLKKQELNSFSKTGRELPLLFANTPGVLAWGENGLGTGTVYMRLRGAAGSRINVTLDGVPLNSPEDQTVFWANMNSYGSLLGSAQIQRGIGTSTNGDGAFGGTISLGMAAPLLKPYLEATVSYGSYNTYNVGGNFSTGLIGNHLVFDGAYHHTGTDGYLHGTSGNSGSYYGGLTWLGDNFKLSYKNVGNYEHTGQAWNGVTAGNDGYSMNSSLGVKTYRDLYKMGMGRFNSLYESFDDKSWTISRYKMDDGSYWKKTTDNFVQDHNILSFSWQPSAHWTHNAALHYTYGHGYYKEFRPNDKFAKFGIYATDKDGKFVKTSDFVRRKGLTQHTYGVIYNVSYKDKVKEIIGGVNLQQFRGNHYGYLDYKSTRTNAVNFAKPYDGDKYYDSDARKYDYSAFLKATGHITPNLDAFADLQYRHVHYKTSGRNDKFYKQADGTYQNQALNIHEDYNFVNPKWGLTFHENGHKAYFSMAYAGREPERNNFTDNGSYPAPKAEYLRDYELGYEYSGGNWHAGANFYYMNYHNQFVQTGQQSDIGENLTTNVKKSYRAGVELTADWSPLSWLTCRRQRRAVGEQDKGLRRVYRDL
jgi:iron complex outermembrane receptor protein